MPHDKHGKRMWQADTPHAGQARRRKCEACLFISDGVL